MKKITICKIVVIALCGLVEFYLIYFVLYLGNIRTNLGESISLLNINNQTELIYINHLMIAQNTALIVSVFLTIIFMILGINIFETLYTIWKPKKK